MDRWAVRESIEPGPVHGREVRERPQSNARLPARGCALRADGPLRGGRADELMGLEK